MDECQPLAAGVQYASSGNPPADNWWTAKFDDPSTNYSSWMAGEEHQIGDAFDIPIYQVSYGALVVYDTDADGGVLHLSTDELKLARISH